MKYRPEIDGLRALAVIPVILFHAGFPLFSGGFVGVDIFFVISGYLITSILIKDIENEQFSIMNFYDRRARRILPALFFVMLSCVPFAFLWMTPIQMKDFSQSFIAVSLFASNLLFGSENGYFALESGTKPLLHTWSLAVEEQYYLLFPIFIYFAWRLGKKKLFLTIVSLFIVSFIASEWGWRNRPNLNFYIAPTRAWELLAGSIAALIIQKHGVRSSDLLSSVGILAIFFAIFAFDESTPSPSLFMGIPVFGSVLLILFADARTFVAKFLSHKVFVGIGLISYSAYLWHQPLFAFSRIRIMGEPGTFLTVILIIFTFLLAAFSWKYIEQPFRTKTFLNNPKLLAPMALSMFLISMSFGLIGHFQNGFIESADAAVRVSGDVSNDKFYSFIKTEFAVPRDLFIHKNAERFHGIVRCRQTKKGKLDIAIVGDSHAEHLFPGLAKACPRKNIGYFVQSEVPSLNNKFFDYVLKNIILRDDVKTVVVSIYKNRLTKETKKGLHAYLTGLGKRNIYLVRDNPSFTKDPAYLKYRKFDSIPDNFNLSVADSHLQLTDLDETYSQFSKTLNVEVVDPFQLLEKQGSVRMYEGEQLFFRDTHHLNIPGSLRFGKVLSKKIW